VNNREGQTGVPTLEVLLQDLRYGLRMLWQNPVFTTAAVLTLALGIGANTAIFSVVYGVIFRPLPYPEPQRIVQLCESYHGATDELDVTYDELQFFRGHAAAFDFLGAYTPVGFNLAMGNESIRIRALHVSSDYFRVLGTKPALGRDFLPEEDRDSGVRVAILSDGLWKRKTGSDPSVVGRAIRLDGDQYVVIGVMPPDFERISTPLSHGGTDVWVPLALVGRTVGGGQNLAVIGRLRKGVSYPVARAQLSVATADFERAFPGELRPTEHLEIQNYRSMLSSDLRSLLFILFGAVGFVLLIACANVANLLLGRSESRTKEIGVRIAMGASRARLFRQFLTESLLLSLLGSLAGLTLAWCGLHVILALTPADLPRVSDIKLDYSAFSFTLIVALLCGIGFGITPAFKSSKIEINEALKESTGHTVSARARMRFRSTLAVSEIGLSLMLLTGAALFIETFWNVLATSPGFDPSHILSMQIWPTGSMYDSTPAVASFYQRALQRIESLPGVDSAAVVTAGLPYERGGNISVEVPGKDTSGSFGFRIISQDYFRALGVPLKLGRTFGAADSEQSRPVVIVNEIFARQLFPDGNILDHSIKIGRSGSSLEIVGVVGDVKSYIDQPTKPTVFIPVAQADYVTMKLFASWFPTTIIVRTSTEPLTLAKAVEGELRAVDSSVATDDIRSMEQVRSGGVSAQRFNMALMCLFAGLAVVLAMIGVYGVVANRVNQRIREIGLRMALGARPGDIVWMVLGEGFRLAGLGSLVGITGSLVFTRLLGSYLYKVKPTDPLTLSSMALLVVTMTLLACWIPARRAMRVDPMVSLRDE
jgi:putative ABC transport system permease protein